MKLSNFIILFIVVIAGCSEKKEKSPPHQTPSTDVVDTDSFMSTRNTTIKEKPVNGISIESTLPKITNTKPKPIVARKKQDIKTSDDKDQYVKPDKPTWRMTDKEKNEYMRKIAKKFNILEPSIGYSNQGPRPPPGGYLYVKGYVRNAKGEKERVILMGGKLYYTDRGERPRKFRQKCNSPYTGIATPFGEKKIKDLKVGDIVLSDAGKAVPIIKCIKRPAINHFVSRIVLDDGTTLEISPGHPAKDNRKLGELIAGDLLDGRRVLSNELIPYSEKFTYDILPDAANGTYWANGVQIKSTLEAGMSSTELISKW